MRIFIAGIMQGSHAKAAIHDQDYRGRIDALLRIAFPEAEIYDPRANHKKSLGYKETTGREVFFGHNFMCREMDVLLAYLPEASMGTAIEMWEGLSARRGGDLDQPTETQLGGEIFEPCFIRGHGGI